MTDQNQEPSFQIPLNLPHAGKVTGRLLQIFERRFAASHEQYASLFSCAMELFSILSDFEMLGENPPPEEAQIVRQKALDLARDLVTEIQNHNAQSDRVGQCVRNIFECLESGQEGARLSLLAGENPDSLQRPV